jgi:hypothetical protein
MWVTNAPRVKCLNFEKFYGGWKPGRKRARRIFSHFSLKILKFGYLLSMSQQAVSADTIPNSAVGIFSPKTEGTKDKSS